MSFANKLKSLRTENKMTQQDVADHLNVARSTVAGYETKNRQPSHEKLTTLANLFRVTIENCRCLLFHHPEDNQW